MSNVILGNFGARSHVGAEASPATMTAEERPPVRVFGQAAGYVVALLHDEAAPEGPVLKIVVGLQPGNLVDTVAILPSTPEGAADAEVTAMAILRTVGLLEDAGRSPTIG